MCVVDLNLLTGTEIMTSCSSFNMTPTSSYEDDFVPESLVLFDNMAKLLDYSNSSRGTKHVANHEVWDDRSDSFDSLSCGDGSPASISSPVTMRSSLAERRLTRPRLLDEADLLATFADTGLSGPWPSADLSLENLGKRPDYYRPPNLLWKNTPPDHHGYRSLNGCASPRSDHLLNFPRNYKAGHAPVTNYGFRPGDEFRHQSPPLVRSGLLALQRPGAVQVRHAKSGSSADKTCYWSGKLVYSDDLCATYSPKVLLTDIPWDISDQILTKFFRRFGGLVTGHTRKDRDNFWKNDGTVFLKFETESQVRALLASCVRNPDSPSEWIFSIPWGMYRSRELKVIPWKLNDLNFITNKLVQLEPKKTVFVSGLHIRISAYLLALIMENLFTGVVYAGIDADNAKFPSGTGKVTFETMDSYMKAVSARHVEVSTPEFTKRIRILPNLVDTSCQVCEISDGPYFCRDLACFKYFCNRCWRHRHSNDALRHHGCLMRRIVYHQGC